MTGQAFDTTDLRILKLRRDRVLTKMAMLSEAPTGAPLKDRVRVSMGTRTEGSPPPETRLDFTDDPDRAPDKNRSLFEHYRWRFQHTTEYRALLLLCFLAERDYMQHALGNRTPEHEDKPSRDARLLRDYAGVHALEAAVFDGVDTMHMRRLRQQNNYDPTFGRPESVAA